MCPNMIQKQKVRMMFDEITEIPRETYNEGPLNRWQRSFALYEGLSVRKFTHDLSMAHYMLLERLHEVSLEDVPWPPYR